MKFAEAYIRLNNQTQAAIEAGYSPASARTAGYRLLQKDDVQEYIRERLREIDEQEIAKTNEVLRFLSSVMRGEVQDQFGLDAQLADRIKAGTELLKRYASVEAEEKDAEAVTIQFVARTEEAAQ